MLCERREGYVAGDKTFCVCLAKDAAAIRRHAEISGFPATTITEIRRMIDPAAERPGERPRVMNRSVADGR